MKRVGKILQQSRESQKLTISEVAAATKINAKVISAIEEGDVDRLPAITFLKGFLRTYAKYLKLDADEIVESFKEEMSEDPNYSVQILESSPREATQSQNNEQSSGQNGGSKSFATKSLLTVGIISLILMIVFIRHTIQKYEREANVYTPPVENPINLAEIEAEEKEQADKTEEETEDAVEEVEVVVEKEEEPKVDLEAEKKAKEEAEEKKRLEAEKKAKEEAEEKKRLEAEKKAKEEAEEKKRLEAEKKAKEEAEEKKRLEAEKKAKEEAEEKKRLEAEKKANEKEKIKDAAEKPQEVIVEALDNTRIRFSIDKNTTRAVSMKANQIQILKAQSTITLTLQNAGAVSLVHNGIYKGVPGDLGKTLSMDFPN